MAEETPIATPTAEETMDSELNELFGNPEIAPDSASLGATPPEGSSQTPAAPETPAGPVETLEQKLEKISSETPDDKTPQPTLTQEQQQILAVVPNAQVAQQLQQTVSNYQNFTGAFERGDFESVEQMFEGWNPSAYEAFLEHVYQKRVASGDWVDRWIADKEGNPTVNHGMKRLEQQIQSLRAQLDQRGQSETQAQQAARNAAIGQAYTSHINGLFDKIDFSAADRRWVMAEINAQVASNMAVRSAIQNGNTAAVNNIFKAAVKEYITRDQQQTLKREETIAAQSKKVPLVGGGNVIQDSSITDDMIKQAKGPQREALLEQKMDQELNALFSKKKK